MQVRLVALSRLSCFALAAALCAVLPAASCSSKKAGAGDPDASDVMVKLDLVNVEYGPGTEIPMDVPSTDIATDIPVDPIVSDTQGCHDAADGDSWIADSDEEVADAVEVDVPPGGPGCSDGTREGFVYGGIYPKVAGCSGAWDVPGIHHDAAPACNRKAGNTGENRPGTGCNVEDLCEAGWHVCRGKKDVLASTGSSGCADVMIDAQSPAFFLTRTSSVGAFECSADVTADATTLDDIFGCGDLGCPVDPVTNTSCSPLTAASHDLCKSIRLFDSGDCDCSFQEDDITVTCEPSYGGCGWCKPLNYWNVKLGESLNNAWECGTDGTLEAQNVTKTDPDRQGGVLCCKG